MLQKSEEKNYDLDYILREENIIVVFHPIISVRKKKIVGWEGLIRAIDEKEQKIIPPSVIFNQAYKENKAVELDRICRKKVIENFSFFYNNGEENLLFLNFDSSIIDKGVVGSGNIIKKVKENYLKPQNVVLEIIESRVENTMALKKFVDIYKSYGFLIALDDFGSSYSNLERLALLKPDIIKVDRFIINNIYKEYHKQEILRSIIQLSHRIGALVISEGIENEEEAITCLELGADLFQGFYFCMPQRKEDLNEFYINEKIENLSHQFRNVMIKNLKNKKCRKIKINNILNYIISNLLNCPVDEFDKKLKETISKYPFIECAYILNRRGIQITNTIFNYSFLPSSFLYSPAVKGSDHSFKEYYFFILSGATQYITEPYISLATGNFCFTASKIFKNAYCKNKFILCIDIYQDQSYC